MILPFPLATSEEIAGVLRPGGGLRSDSALRTLRENGLAAPQMSVVPRSGGADRGRMVWYSSLMLDVARFHRWRDHEGARSALKAASEMSRHRSSMHVIAALLDGELEPGPGRLDEATGGALSRLALLSESRRQGLSGIGRLGRSTGVVVDRSNGLAIVDTGEAARLGVPAPPVEQARLGAIGSLVAVELERLDDRSSFVWVRPAFEASSDPHSRVPGPPHLLSEVQRRRIERDVLVVG